MADMSAPVTSIQTIFARCQTEHSMHSATYRLCSHSFQFSSASSHETLFQTVTRKQTLNDLSQAVRQDRLYNISACKQKALNSIFSFCFYYSDISMNEISSIAANAFVGMSSLQTLFISPPNMISIQLIMVRFRYITDNRLTALPVEAFGDSSVVTSLMELYAGPLLILVPSHIQTSMKSGMLRSI